MRLWLPVAWNTTAPLKSDTYLMFWLMILAMMTIKAKVKKTSEWAEGSTLLWLPGSAPQIRF